MRTFLFIVIVLISGLSAGLIHGAANLVFVEPSLDQAIGIENQHLFASGEAKDTPEFRVEFDSYRYWQKSGQVLAGAILGISIGSLFGIIFVLSRHSLPGKSYVSKSLILAGIMWLAIYFIPFLKYPANPPTVGDPDTVVLRSILFLTFIAISGFGALGFYKIFKKLKNKKFIAILGYAVFIGMVFFAMPENPDKITAPMSLVDHFRMMSAVAVSIYWLSLGIILGSLWNHFKPDNELKSAFN
ncbi:CbtA family protein [Nitrosarchaeum koreense]|uniref:Putative membrane protein n=1 Tax=Nitrosarchaeum koreense MY1 TaxID=1001994 RepID=F9CWV7_9ARCH|nr:CbtA family protein [Nitrosarchaeum koreense]EGP93759.1 Putative membrane protein [Nitrosarchaeum koreense MY1]